MKKKKQKKLPLCLVCEVLAAQKDNIKRAKKGKKPSRKSFTLKAKVFYYADPNQDNVQAHVRVPLCSEHDRGASFSPRTRRRSSVIERRGT